MYREDKARQQRNQKGNQKRKQFSCNGTGNRNNQQPPEKKRRGVVSLVALAPFGDPDTSSKPSLRTSPSPSRVFRCLLATLTRRCRFNIAQKPSAAAAALHLFPTLSFFEGGLVPWVWDRSRTRESEPIFHPPDDIGVSGRSESDREGRLHPPRKC